MMNYLAVSLHNCDKQHREFLQLSQKPGYNMISSSYFGLGGLMWGILHACVATWSSGKKNLAGTNLNMVKYNAARTTAVLLAAESGLKLINTINKWRHEGRGIRRALWLTGVLLENLRHEDSYQKEKFVMWLSGILEYDWPVATFCSKCFIYELTMNICASFVSHIYGSFFSVKG